MITRLADSLKAPSAPLPKEVKMDKTKHTPGPWHTGPFTPEEVFAEKGRMRLEEDGTTLYPIARTFDFVGEGKANARLIAAAPDYDEGARQAVEWLPLIKQDYPEMQGLIKALESLEAAIAKATGE